jgi:hypothetical protein
VEYLWYHGEGDVVERVRERYPDYFEKRSGDDWWGEYDGQSTLIFSEDLIHSDNRYSWFKAASFIGRVKRGVQLLRPSRVIICSSSPSFRNNSLLIQELMEDFTVAEI